MEFTELRIYASTMGLEAAGGVLDAAGVSCCSIQDPADLKALLEDRTVPADYVEDGLLTQEEPFMSVYLACNEQGNGQLESIVAGVEKLKEEFRGTFGSFDIKMRRVCDDDWRDNWKQYFKPLEIGDSLLIRPSWEKSPDTDRLEIVIDPESSFGTGQHETTRLCLCALERHELAGKEVLDAGCGSGILGIGALLLGAGHVTAFDIDANAADIARRNFERNIGDSSRYSVYAGDALKDEKLEKALRSGKYGIIAANIVADVIRELLPLFRAVIEEDGVLICSGIIAPRASEVTAAMEECGFAPVEAEYENDWAAITAVPV